MASTAVAVKQFTLLREVDDMYRTLGASGVKKTLEHASPRALEWLTDAKLAPWDVITRSGSGKITIGNVGSKAASARNALRLVTGASIGTMAVATGALLLMTGAAYAHFTKHTGTDAHE